MPKRKRREQQHLRQEQSRRKSYSVGGTAPNEIYKPGFPMNMFGNLKLFSLIGVVVVAIMLVTAILTTRRGNSQADDVPTPTPVPSVTQEASVTPSTTPTTFSAADQVIDSATKNYSATVKTSMGDFTIKLNADGAPNTVNSFVFLAQKGYFNNMPVHRVVDNFVIQTGDGTKGDGTGTPGYQTNDEPNQIKNTRGTVSMAKRSGAGAFGSQWFVNVKDNPSLDYNSTANDKFYPFGEVTSGMDVVDAISKVQVNSTQRPVQPVTVTEVTITETAK